MQRSGVDERQKPRAGTTIGDTILEEVGSTVAHQPTESLPTATTVGMQPGAGCSRFNSVGVFVSTAAGGYTGYCVTTVIIVYCKCPQGNLNFCLVLPTAACGRTINLIILFTI